MKVVDIMVRNVKFCHPDQNLAQVAEIMWNGGCGTLPVLDPQGRLWSIITDRDIAIALGTRNLKASDVQVADVAVPRYFACKANEDIHSALRTMAAQEVRRLPVINDEGGLEGILSMDDIILQAKAGSQINFTDVVNALQTIYRQPLHGQVAITGAAA
ncbi:MAG TPA: CBS domain-containing protein [Bryobacteraceae bacterium]